MTRRATVGALLCASLATAQPAVIDRCIAASAKAQAERDAARLMSARTEFQACALAACPEVVRQDCRAWLVELERQLPSLLVTVRDDAGRDLPAQVSLDGAPLAALDGLPVSVDPGPHQVAVTVGARRLEESVVVALGEQRRAVAFVLERPSRQFPGVGPLVLGGVGVAGLGLFTALAVSGRADLDALGKAPCAATKTCAPSAVEAIRSRFIAADVALAVGLSALATGLVWWWFFEAPPPVAATLSVMPGQARVELTARF